MASTPQAGGPMQRSTQNNTAPPGRTAQVNIAIRWIAGYGLHAQLRTLQA
jgi:hypothetical protein